MAANIQQPKDLNLQYKAYRRAQSEIRASLLIALERARDEGAAQGV